MVALQQTFNSISRNLRGLTPTAKLLIASLMVILLMTMFLVAQYTSRAVLEPLGLHVNLTTEARGKAINYLRGRNINFRERGSEILVPPDQKYAILAQLTDGQIITPDQIDFDSLIRKDSPFLSRAQMDRQWLTATMNILSRTVANMSGIDRAVVVINEPKNLGGLGQARTPASASVSLWTRGSEPLDQGRVDAIAALVAGAHAALRAIDVEIVDMTAGRSHRARPPEARASTATLELQLVNERLVREKISDSLAYIPGVNVAVQVIVDPREVIEQRRQFDEPKIGPTQERTHRIDSSSTTGAGGEAGIRPNTGAAVASAARRGSNLTDERSEAAMIPFVGGSDSRITDPRGHAVQINATIGVPKSYFVRLFQDRRGDASLQPDEGELNALVEAETSRIRAQIEPLIDTSAVDGARTGSVFVSMIPDFGMTLALGALGPGGMPAMNPANGSGGIIANAVGEGAAGYIGLAVLAVVSLTVMFMMVRRATAREQLPTAAELVGAPPTLGGDENDLVGEANETTPSLVGVEIDDDQLRRQQMLEQINDMARNQPSETALLIRRWVKAEV